MWWCCHSKAANAALQFGNIRIILKWFSIWGMVPEVRGQKSPEGVYSQKAAGEAREESKQQEKGPAVKQVGMCQKALGQEEHCS